MVAKAKKTAKKRSTATKPRKEVHIHEIPNKYFPRDNPKAKKYQKELLRMMVNLRDTNERVQYSSQICAFNVRSIASKSGFIPSRPEVFRHLKDFVYHYENYCFRAYSFREKLIQFLNAFLRLNFDERDVKIKFIQINPTVINAGLSPMLGKFEKHKKLENIIQDRNLVTHKLYYGETFDHYLRPISPGPVKDGEFKKWCNSWKREITIRSKNIDEITHMVSDMNHELARKLIKYKEPKKIK